MVLELRTEYDARASFYWKAFVEVYDDGSKVLYSYGTRVASITGAGDVKLFDLWDCSQTTVRHVKEFLLQSNKKAGTKKEISQLYTKA